MRGSLTISAIAHVIILGLCLVALAATPNEAPQPPTVSVNTISTSDFNKITQGIKDAPKPKIPDPKPLADKVDVPKPADQAANKVDDKKPEIKTETAAKETKPDPKPAEKPAKAKTPDYKPDQIADILKKDAAKQPPKIDAKPTPDTPAKKVGIAIGSGWKLPSVMSRRVAA